MNESTQRVTDGGGWEEQAGYSRAVRRGSTIVVSGTTAHGPDGSVLRPGDTYAQTTVCLARVEQAGLALGGTLADVVRTGVYLDPDASWEDAGRAHRELLGEVAPANTTLYVHGLVGDGFLVEVEAFAVLAT